MSAMALPRLMTVPVCSSSRACTQYLVLWPSNPQIPDSRKNQIHLVHQSILQYAWLKNVADPILVANLLLSFRIIASRMRLNLSSPPAVESSSSSLQLHMRGSSPICLVGDRHVAAAMPDDMSVVPYNGGNLDVVLYVIENPYSLASPSDHIKQSAQ